MLIGFRVLGILMVLAGSVGVGLQKKEKMKQRFFLCRDYKQLLFLCSHAILRNRLSFQESLVYLDKNMKNPWKSFFDQLNPNEEKVSVEEFLEQLNIFLKHMDCKEEEKRLYEELGEVFLSQDQKKAQARIDFLVLEQKRIEKEIYGKRKQSDQISVAISVSIGMLLTLFFL